MQIQVNCRPTAGILEEEIPYALVTTLEVATDLGIDIYNEVREAIPTKQVIPVINLKRQQIHS